MVANIAISIMTNNILDLFASPSYIRTLPRAAPVLLASKKKQRPFDVKITALSSATGYRSQIQSVLSPGVGEKNGKRWMKSRKIVGREKKRNIGR